MKFLVDAQLPEALSDFLNRKGHDSVHTLDLPHGNETNDREIIRIAGVESRIVISKDRDFLESFLLRSEPAALIMVRTGNIPNDKLLQIFENNLDVIAGMASRSNLIEIGRNVIAEY